MPGVGSDAVDSALDPDLPSAARWIRPKGNLSQTELSALLAVALLPIVIVVVRVLSMPDVLGGALSGSWLAAIGRELSHVLSLHDVPAADRNRVLYMLFLPTSALVIAIARLTFGIRVIGFRAILISVGFQQSGIGPSLILIGVVVTIVTAVRPALRRIRLPQVARISVIMTIAVIILMAALLIAPWTRSDVLWGVAFFPVIVLGLLAESIAQTLDKTTGVVAVWRTFMTIGIAMLLAICSQIPFLREVAIQFPELVFTQLIMIILVAEFFDLRLFQDWDARLSGIALPRLFAPQPGMRIAIVRNRRKNGVIGRLGPEAAEGYSRREIRRIAAGLSARGHTVERFEGDMTLLSKLREFLPPHPRTGEPGGLVLNLAPGIQGEAAAGHVPALLEMAGLAYVGAGPVGHALMQDRWLRSQALQATGLSVPEVRIVRSLRDPIEGFAYPMIVRSRRSGEITSRLVRDREALEDALRKVLRRAGPDALVERYVPGRQIEAALIGNDRAIDCLPLVEIQSDGEAATCPAPLDADLAGRACDVAREAFRICGARDAAQISLRISRGGGVYVTGVASLHGLEEGGVFERASLAEGRSTVDAIERILAAATERYRPGHALRALPPLDVDRDDEPAKGRPLIAGP